MKLEDTDVEIWKDIKGFEGLYAVSSKGNVKNIRSGRILDGYYNHYGYRLVFLKDKQYTVHRLVALTFLDNPNNLPQVDHRDENKRNNDVSNLRWVTASENTRNSSHKYSCKVKQLDKNGNLIKIWPSLKQIERELGYSRSRIRMVCTGKRRSAYNFRWEYLDSSSQRIVNRQVIAYKGTEFIGEFANAVKAAEALGLKYKCVHACLKGLHASNKGFTFTYK